MSNEEHDPWEERSREIPEFFSPCPDCTLARECIRHFRISPPRNEVEKRTYFKNWISRCVNHCGVKSRQELLFLADHWSNYHIRTIPDRRRHSYKTTIGHCLSEIINEQIYGVQLYQCNRQNFYYSGDLTEEIERYAQDTVEFTRNLKMQNDPIGDCLIETVAEYFRLLGMEARIKAPVDRNVSDARGRMDIDVLTDEYAIEVRNHSQPLDRGGLYRVFVKYHVWEENGFNQTKVLVCPKTIGRKVIRICQNNDVRLIEIGYQIIPEEIERRAYGNNTHRRCLTYIRDSDVARAFVWWKMQEVLNHPDYERRVPQFLW